MRAGAGVDVGEGGKRVGVALGCRVGIDEATGEGQGAKEGARTARMKRPKEKTANANRKNRKARGEKT
jgi:hypothetical protein